MINIYQKPTPKKPTLGMTIHYFETMEIINDRTTFESYVDANRRIELNKKAALANNIETFWSYCENLIEEETHSEEEAINATRELSIFILNSNNYKNCLEQTIKNANFMRLLCRVTKDDNAIMMATVILRFCKDECEEIESFRKSM